MNTIKRIIAAAIAFVFIFALSACKSNDQSGSSSLPSEQTNNASQTAPDSNSESESPASSPEKQVSEEPIVIINEGPDSQADNVVDAGDLL